MAITQTAMFQRFKHQIKALPMDYTDDMLLNETFLLDKDQGKGLEIYYAPFEYVNQQAKVIIVGITPGLHQMKRAYSTVIKTTGTDEDILKKVKETSSFHGPMRKNLVAMLDELKLADYLGIATTEQLFNVYHHYLQSTSVLPHAVFYKGKNYNGATPKISSNNMLRKYVHTYFTKNIQGIEPHPTRCQCTGRCRRIDEDRAHKSASITKRISSSIRWKRPSLETIYNKQRADGRSDKAIFRNR